MDKKLEKALERFDASYMSNAKWEKLLTRLTYESEEIFFSYKLVYDEDIRQNSIDLPDDASFFIEPIIYKEVEWIAFPAIYEDFVSHNNLKAGKKAYHQDIDRIEQIIHSLGQFLLERSEGSLKLYAYR